MSVTRIDLADVGSPEKLVIEILKAEPDLPIPVPVEKLAFQLGITDIKDMDSDGFIGGLITNETKSTRSHPRQSRPAKGTTALHRRPRARPFFNSIA